MGGGIPRWPERCPLQADGQVEDCARAAGYRAGFECTLSCPPINGGQPGRLISLGGGGLPCHNGGVPTRRASMLYGDASRIRGSCRDGIMSTCGCKCTEDWTGFDPKLGSCLTPRTCTFALALKGVTCGKGEVVRGFTSPDGESIYGPCRCETTTSTATTTTTTATTVTQTSSTATTTTTTTTTTPLGPCVFADSNATARVTSTSYHGTGQPFYGTENSVAVTVMLRCTASLRLSYPGMNKPYVDKGVDLSGLTHNTNFSAVFNDLAPGLHKLHVKVDMRALNNAGFKYDGVVVMAVAGHVTGGRSYSGKTYTTPRLNADKNSGLTAAVFEGVPTCSDGDRCGDGVQFQPQWGPIRFRPPTCTHTPNGAYV